MRALLTLAFASSLFLLAPPGHAQGGPGETNVVFISLDDVGCEPFSFFPDAFPNTAASQNLYAEVPRMQAMAEGGLICLNAYSAPVCSPARANAITGRLPHRSGIGTVIRQQTFTVNGQELPGAVAELDVGPGNDEILLPEVLTTGGVHTGMIGKVHLMLWTDEIALGGLPGYGWGWIPDKSQFDWYSCAYRNLNQSPFPGPRGEPWGYWNWIRNKNGVVETLVGDGTLPLNHATTTQVDDALEFVAQATEPFFLYLSFNAPHGPYHKPPAQNILTAEYDQPPGTWDLYNTQGIIGQSIWTNYMGMLEDIDLNIGRLIDQMPQAVYDNTLFIVMGDNGTPREVLDVASRPLPTASSEFGFHGHGKDIGPVYKRLLADEGERFKRSIYEPGTHVPLFFFGNGVTNPGRVTNALFSVEDLFSTIAEAHEVDLATALPVDHELDSISFMPVLEDLADEYTHARQDRLVEWFEPNGDPAQVIPAGGEWPDDTFKHYGFVHHEPGIGIFKIVRTFTPAHDKFFRLADATWNPQGKSCDPYELRPLQHGPTANPDVRQAYVNAAHALKVQIDL